MKLLMVPLAVIAWLYSGTVSAEYTDCSEESLSLNFSNIEIHRIGKDAISNPIIKCINLQGNEVADISEGAFDKVPNLIYLNLARNRLSSLFSFGGHPNLETLLLNNQYAGYVTLTISGHFPQLRSLYMQGHQISNIHYIYSKSTEMNNIRENPFPKLMHLDLSDTYIGDSNVHLFFSGSLTHLYLNNVDMNYLNNVGMNYFSFQTLANLTHLALDNNDIEDITQVLYGLSNLEHLSASQNRVYSVDFAFDAMSKLLFLNLSYNHINNISPAAFNNLNALEILDLSQNLLEHVPVLLNSTQLQILYLNCNRISALAFDSFVNYLSLRQLYLMNNMISVVEKHTFSPLTNLEELYLAGNDLSILPSDWIAEMVNLHYLDLSNNHFKHLAALSLSNTVPLLSLYLSGNPLNNIQAKSLYDLPENVTIYLVPNFEKSPVVCNPEYHETRRYY